MTSPLLAGLRIVDLSMFVAGPFSTSILAEMGAEVIKVEPPGGDPVRNNAVGPEIGGQSAQWHTYNHDKKSIVLDLKSETGKQVLRDLAAKSDIVFDNFRPGVTERLGIDHASLVKSNPRLVTVSLSGFGATGPWALRPGYDLIVQALGGGLGLCGHAQTGPAHIPYHLGDTAGGLYAAIAMLAAVLEARRTGRGRALEVSMLDAQLHLLGDEITNSGTGQWPGRPHGSGHPALAPYAVYRTADGPIVIAAVGVEKFWHNLLNALDLEDMADDPRFADNGARATNQQALTALLEERLATKPAGAWLDLLERHDVPCAPVLGVEAAAGSAHSVDRDLVSAIAAGEEERASVPRIPVRDYGGSAVSPLQPAPQLNADLRYVLQEVLGYDSNQIEDFNAGTNKVPGK